MTVIVVGDIDWVLVGWLIGVTVAMLYVFGSWGAVLAENRGRDPLAGALLGMLFGPLGWLVIVAVGRQR